MNILHVCPSHPSRMCGISTYTDRLVESLKRRGMGSEIVGKGFDPKALVREWEHETRQQADRAEVIHVQYAFDLYGYLGIATWPAFRHINALGKPIVTTVHELPPVRNSSPKSKVAGVCLRQNLRFVGRSSDLIFVHSDVNRATIGRIIDPAKVRVVPHGVAAGVNGTLGGISLRPAPTDKTLGFLGFLNPNKGVHLLIDALADLPDVRLVVAGAPKGEADRAYAESLRDRAVDSGVGERVEFLGYVPDPDLPPLFARLDAVVLPYSVCTASGVLAIALAHGCVVLTSDLPVFRELQRQYDCLETFVEQDRESLHRGLQTVLYDAVRRDALAAGAARAAAAASWDTVAENMERIYQELVVGVP